MNLETLRALKIALTGLKTFQNGKNLNRGKKLQLKNLRRVKAVKMKTHVIAKKSCMSQKCTNKSMRKSFKRMF